MTRATLLLLLVAPSAACSRSASVLLQPAGPSASLVPVRSSPDSVVVPGACPFECCQYGTWVLRTVAFLRAAPSRGAQLVGQLAVGDTVTADSGLVIVSPTGIVLAISDFHDRDSGLELPRGDTLYLLNELGEGFWNARWHDSTVSVTMWDIDSTGSHGAKLIRQPISQWWAHLTARGAALGWADLDVVDVSGADACG